MWCWAAVSEMALRYYGHPNVNPVGDYQCGIVGAAGALGLLPPICNFDCTQPQCVVPIGSASRLVSFLQQYPNVARQATGIAGRPFTVQYFPRSLSFDEIKTTISSGAPIMAGITPAGIPNSFSPAHVALIVGYDTGVSGGQGLLVNDPFPYGIGPLGPYGDPYLQRNAQYISQGRYLIDYRAFSQGLFWTETIVLQ